MTGNLRTEDPLVRIERTVNALHGPKEPIELPPSIHAFMARFDGECGECHEPIDAGVHLIVHSTMSGYVHEECL